MTTERTFYGKTYDISIDSDGFFILSWDSAETQRYEDWFELVADHPVCEESAVFFDIDTSRMQNETNLPQTIEPDCKRNLT